jgi:DNA-binding FrmR family transcriptional regulator
VGFTTPDDGAGPVLDEPEWGPAEALIKRLRRVEGQARGLQKMLAEGRECEEVIIQLAAMREAINKVGMAVIGKYMEKCMRQDMTQGKSGREGLERAVSILMKFS